MQTELFEKYLEDRRNDYWDNFYKQKLEEVRANKIKSINTDVDVSMQTGKEVPIMNLINKFKKKLNGKK
jgi:hypothetical protein